MDAREAAPPAPRTQPPGTALEQVTEQHQRQKPSLDQRGRNTAHGLCWRRCGSVGLSPNHTGVLSATGCRWNGFVKQHWCTKTKDPRALLGKSRSSSHQGVLCPWPAGPCARGIPQTPPGSGTGRQPPPATTAFPSAAKPHVPVPSHPRSTALEGRKGMLIVSS